MANRIMLNETSYHGAGAIQEIAGEAKAHGFQKAFVCTDPDLLMRSILILRRTLPLRMYRMEFLPSRRQRQTTL